MKLLKLVAVALALGVPLAGGVQAQTYPSGPITIVVPFPPGGSVDAAARVLASQLSIKFNQSVLVENRPGATGSIGTASALSSAPDGYTLLIGNTDPLAANVINFPDLPYDPRTDLDPVALLYRSVYAIVVTNSLPVDTFEEFIDYARANPDTLSYGSSGIGSALHFAGELLNRDAGIDMLHIPYQGGGPAVTDVIAGQLPVTVATLPSVVPYYAEGQLKILAVSTEERHPNHPEIPTVHEYLPGFILGGWGALVAPKGTPEDIIAILTEAVFEALEAEEVQRVYDGAGLLLTAAPPEVVTEMIHAEIDLRQSVIDSGITLD